MPLSISLTSTAAAREKPEGDADGASYASYAMRVSSGSGGMNPGAGMIGEVITVRWAYNGGLYPALVVGYRSRANTHKLYYPLDNKVEVANLSKRDWQRDAPNVPGWDTDGLVGRRIVMFLEEAYEAFVVKYHGNFTYTILYPDDDGLETRDMGNADARNQWELFEYNEKDEHKNVFEGETVVSWSS